jgi:hypothetical protein
MAPNTEKYPKGYRFKDYRFIWADKAALAVALILLLFLACAWLITFASVGSLGAFHVWDDVGVSAIKLDLLIAGAVWVALRCIDFAIGGSTYRLFVRSQKPAPHPAPWQPAPERRTSRKASTVPI